MSRKIAFSAETDLHTGKGGPQTVVYGNTYHASPHWDGKTFHVPRDGIYFISVSYIRDSMDPDDGDQGTYLDTNLRIYVGEEFRAYAWAGSANIPRQPASTAVLLPLKCGETVTTRDWALKDEFRRFRHCVITCYRVGKC